MTTLVRKAPVTTSALALAHKASVYAGHHGDKVGWGGAVFSSSSGGVVFYQYVEFKTQERTMQYHNTMYCISENFCIKKDSRFKFCVES